MYVCPVKPSQRQAQRRPETARSGMPGGRRAAYCRYGSSTRHGKSQGTLCIHPLGSMLSGIHKSLIRQHRFAPSLSHSKECGGPNRHQPPHHVGWPATAAASARNTCSRLVWLTEYSRTRGRSGVSVAPSDASPAVPPDLHELGGGEDDHGTEPRRQRRRRLLVMCPMSHALSLPLGH